MNATSRAILQTVLSTDVSLSAAEKNVAQRLVNGLVETPDIVGTASDEQLLVTQKRAAELLSVSRATIWRMTKNGVLHPIELLPGTWRYSFRELFALAQKGCEGGGAHRERSAA
ncbi:MAG: helix-turn-helix domain-containing protein [Nibricoccus sp.]